MEILDLFENPSGLIIAGIAGFMVISAGFLLKNPQWFARAKPEQGLSDAQVLVGRMGRLEKRVDQIEQDIQHLPTTEDIHALDKKIIGMRGDIRLIEATTTQTRNGVSMIQDFMLNQSTKGTT